MNDEEHESEFLHEVYTIECSMRDISNVIHGIADTIIYIRTTAPEKYRGSSKTQNLYNLVRACRNVADRLESLTEDLKDFS